MYQITLFQEKKSKNFPPPHTSLPRRIRRLDGRALGAYYSAPRLRLKDDLCFRLLLGRARMSSKLPSQKMADTSQDELQLGGGIRRLTATSQYHAHRKQVPTCVSNLYINRGRYVHAILCPRPCVAAACGGGGKAARGEAALRRVAAKPRLKPPRVAAKPRAAKPRVRVSRRSRLATRPAGGHS